MKRATTIEEQIDRLEERGMSFNDKGRAAEILLDKGYYRLGFYWFPMEKSYPSKERRNHYFKDGASFDKSVRLYEFDKELRNILSYFIHDIKVNLRTKVIYYVSNEYKNDPVWFVNNDIVMASFIESFIIKYNNDIKKNDVISRHHANHPDHQYAPAWKTLEYISFGDLIRLIDNLKNSDLKKKIYNQYGLSEDKTFANYIDVVRKMRNNCAHGHPLFDTKLAKSLRAGKFKTLLKGDQGDLWSTLRGVLLVIQYFLFYLPGDKGTDFSKSIKKLMNQNRKADIMEYVSYLNDIPWLNKKL